MIVTKKLVEHRLAHMNDFETFEIRGWPYVQITASRTKEVAESAMRQLHQMGYRARITPLVYNVAGRKKAKAYMVMAGPKPEYEIRHFADSYYFQTGHGREWTRKRVKKS